MKKQKTILALGLWALGLSAVAAPTADLQTLLNQFQSLQANFQETLVVQGQAQDITGTVQIARPNRFRWETKTPNPELFVSDGQQLWQYEEDLEQVTVSPINRQVVMQSPMLLLSGKVEAISTLYDVKAEGRERFLLTPKTQGGLIQSFTVQFHQGRLSELEINNTLGQTIHIHFADVRLNQAINPKAFEFTPPAGVDVLRQ